MIIETAYNRRIDSAGRLVFPAPFRKEYGINIGDFCQLFVITVDNRTFLGIECKENNSIIEIEKAKKLLQDAGYFVEKK